jgi:hypothetical protein
MRTLWHSCGRVSLTCSRQEQESERHIVVHCLLRLFGPEERAKQGNSYWPRLLLLHNIQRNAPGKQNCIDCKGSCSDKG